MIGSLRKWLQRLLGVEQIGLQVQRVASAQLVYRERSAAAASAVAARLAGLENLLQAQQTAILDRFEGLQGSLANAVKPERVDSLEAALLDRLESMEAVAARGENLAEVLTAVVGVGQAVASSNLEGRVRQQKLLDWLRTLAEKDGAQLAGLAAIRAKLNEKSVAPLEILATVQARVVASAAESEARDRKLLDWVKAMTEQSTAHRDALATVQARLIDLANAAPKADSHQVSLAAIHQLLAEIRKTSIELDGRTGKIADWQTAIGKVLGELRSRDVATLVAQIDGLADRIGGDVQARVSLMNDLNRRHENLAAETLSTLRQLTGQPLLRPLESDAPPTDRAFGLAATSPNPELEGLLALGRFLQDDPTANGALSAITGASIRRMFPAGLRQHRVIEARSGLRLSVDASDIYAAGAVFGRIQEADDFAIFMAMVAAGSVVVDVGANFGLYAAHAALYAGQTGKVFAFEPAPDSHKLLAANISDNGLDAICRVTEAIVAAAPGEATFYVAADSAFSGLSDTHRSPIAETLLRSVVSLDTFAPLKAEAAVDLLKIDVEGFEGEVLAGARDLVSRSPDLLIMMEFCYKNLTDERRAAVIAELQALEAQGRAIHLLRPAEAGFELQRARAADLAQNLNENLFVCSPDGQTSARLRTAAAARRVTVPGAQEAAALALLKRSLVKA